jgi:hypothetical protein
MTGTVSIAGPLHIKALRQFCGERYGGFHGNAVETVQFVYGDKLEHSVYAEAGGRLSPVNERRAATKVGVPEAMETRPRMEPTVVASPSYRHDCSGGSFETRGG